jgi:predicted enzyme related to lactoylglutathione lyase
LTPADVVWEFYRRELPGWQESRQRGRGRSLIQRAPDCERTVRVYSQNGGTLVENKVSMKGLASAAAAASGDFSDSGSGVLR